MSIHRTAHTVLMSTLFLTIGAQAIRAQQAPAATELLRQAASNFKTTRSLQFTLTARAIPTGLRLAAVSGGDGVIVWPDRLVFQGTLQHTPALAVSFVTVMCGAEQHVEMGDSVFQKMAGAPNIGRLLFAPDTSFVASILTQLEQVSAPRASTVDRVAAWHVIGTVPGRLVATLPGRTAPSVEPLRAELWIGKQDLRVRQLTLIGPMFDGDSAKATRTLTFSRFNERLPLTVPRGRIPCGAQP